MNSMGSQHSPCTQRQHFYKTKEVAVVTQPNLKTTTQKSASWRRHKQQEVKQVSLYACVQHNRKSRGCGPLVVGALHTLRISLRLRSTMKLL